MKQHNMRIRKANPVKLSNFVNTVVNNLSIGPRIVFVELKKSWKEIVGATNAMNTYPVSLKDGILTIAVSSPAWITQARFYKSSFIKKINIFLLHDDVIIHDIRFILEGYQ